MSRYVKALARLTMEDIALAGGKACRLGELARAGLPVPRGIVVLTTAYDDYFGANGLERRLAEAPSRPGSEWLEAARQELASSPLPDGFEAELFEGLERCGLSAGAALAVRSSAPGEDGAYRSRAGAYESILNVSGPEAVLEAVRSCWASLWAERAAMYRAGDVRGGRSSTGGDPGGSLGADRRPGRPSMAVLIQELVPCHVAGILFTLNPLTADENEMLVEATWGLAAELASGEVTPDRFVIDFWDGDVRRLETGRKPEALSPVPSGGVRRRAVDPDRIEEPCLGSEQLSELAALGRRVQEVFGHPQDVEFGFAPAPGERAGSTGSTNTSQRERMTGGPQDTPEKPRLWVLQSRPITAYSFAPDVAQWTTANFREVMPGFAGLLGQSQSFHHDFSRAQKELFRRLKLWRAEDEGTVWCRTFFGHGYWNAGATKRVAARIPGFNERSFDQTVGIDPTYSGDGLVTPWNLKTIATAVPVLLALGREYRRIPEEAKAFTRWFEREEPGWNELRPADLDAGTLAERVRWGLELHWQANRWALLISFLSTQAQEDFHRTLAGLEAKAEREGSALTPSDLPAEARLLTGLEAMATTKPLHDMWELADGLRRYPGVIQTLRDTPPGELAARLSTLGRNGPDAEGWQLVSDWITRYRHMSNIDEDLSVPRWGEDPSVPLSMLRGYLSDPAGDGGRRPAEHVERQRRVREEEEARARALGRRWLRFGLDPFWLGRFEKQYNLVKTLCWWREETRVYLSRARYHTRRFLLEQGRRWAAAGLLAEPGDIFWLTRDEVLELTRGAGAPGTDGFDRAREMAGRRRSMAVLFRNFAVPPNIQPGPFGADGLPHGTGAVTVGLVEVAAPSPEPASGLTSRPKPVSSDSPEPGGRLLTGVGCSAGTATGPCRVVRNIEEAADLRAGEILVAPHANPAWVPLFHLAAGLVLEEGGLLSHSAVVAREHGIPAVLQVKKASTVLKTGDVLRIDGLAGTVAVSRSG